MADPVYSVGLELVAGSFTEVGSDMLRASGSRRVASIFEGMAAGRADVVLDNGLGKYTPDNAASPYSGLLKPNTALRVQGTMGTSVYNVFNGFVDRWSLDPDPTRRSAHIQATDRVKKLLRRRIDTPIRVDVKANSLVTDILSAAGMAASYRLVDATIVDSVSFAWFRNTAPLRALADVMDFGYYRAYVDAAGAVRVRSRYLGLEGASVASYVAGPTASGAFLGLDYALSDERVINLSRVEGEPRKISAAVNTVAWLEETPFIVGSGFFGFWLAYLDPDTLERDTPAMSVSITRSADWLMNTSTDADVGSDRTATGSLQFTAFGASVVCTLFNGSPDQVYVNKFQTRGYSIQRQPQIQREAQDSSSQNVYGQRDFALSNDFVSALNYAQDYADFLKLTWKEPKPDVTFALKNQFPDVLARELTDIVYLQESTAAISSKYLIVGIDWGITFARGLEHSVIYDCELADVGAWLILDHDPLGKLDSGRQLAF